jgi:hypothetical protein
LAENSSWAARNKAAAPSPNTSIDIDKTMAANRKRNPGSIAGISALASSLAKVLEPDGNAVITGLPGFAARESGFIDHSARPVYRPLKIGRVCGDYAVRLRISCRARLSGNGLRELHKILICGADQPELS